MTVKTRNISIVSSFVCLWLASLLASDLETVCGFILIFSFGILHGANDLLLFDKMALRKGKSTHFIILAIYIGLVILVFSLFLVIPLWALSVFIVFSAYHFGEQHWERSTLNSPVWIKKLFFGIYGLFVLALLFVLNATEVLQIVYSISSYQFSPKILEYGFIIISLMFLAITGYLAFKQKNFRKNGIEELLYLLVFSIIFKISSLIWGFAIYFIFWHSLPSLYDQITFVYKDFNTKNALAYTKAAFPYWLISVVAMVAFYFVFKSMDIFYALFFSFLAAVTFPHTFAIHTMFKRIRKGNS
ncbi:hypothetical protein ESY86_06210 [Subsaximicrobium wynnwilliamsii]|uniref:Probable beta-carotene 15,15'-dioxygenase n=1 Tax=Subsaximicrobium wynnwilliamsii TaxID=291179 RepID=A0A5C6ZJ51_9FLAO|nr:Brp/Blh family beta-carotene 15,15'-dioxygenase [Subsaximicrobium wynnwilliamsii]TXD84175.1 hypothetical protein ESY87_06625 [Subsaximicrobium wynnwilliamsii]TXD89796.1 hypothetical protein ESY86_06210 [Subsaximicrobium wynnwilliamsii]TXE03887.1 hypothetical protein ESY88_06620 [Subsaximicrobium wynnwilliamsii]